MVGWLHGGGSTGTESFDQSLCTAVQLLLPAGPHVQKASKDSQSAPLVKDQLFKHVSLHGIFYIEIIAYTVRS